MTDKPASAAVPNSSKRPWYRLHRSTLGVVLLAAIVLVLIILPGENMDMINYPPRGITCYFEHGWPWVFQKQILLDNFYAKCTTIPIRDIGESIPPWAVPEGWIFFADTTYFSPIYLFLDILAAAAILTFISFFLEWRRRRRNLRIWQFSLLEICVLGFVVAGVMSWWAVRHRQALFENELNIDQQCCGGYTGPVFLGKLVGEGNLPDCWNIISFRWSPAQDPRSFEEKEVRKMISELNRLKYLKSVTTSSYDVTVQEIPLFAGLKNIQYFSVDVQDDLDTWLQAIHSMKSLKTLTLMIPEKRSVDYEADNNPPQAPQDYKSLANLPSGLRELYLITPNIDNDTVPILGSLSFLEKLDISNSKISPDNLKKLKALLPNCDIVVGSGAAENSDSKHKL